jgi:hypothetical protein
MGVSFLRVGLKESFCNMQDQKAMLGKVDEVNIMEAFI